MAYLGNTGQGGTVTLGTTGAVGSIRSCKMPTWTMESIDASHLGSTGFAKKIPGDLTDPGEAVIEVIFDATIDIPTPGTVETVTITLPIGAGLADPGDLTGTAFISITDMPNLAINELMVMTLTVTFDGDTGPTWDTESA